jgi:hypothetical protein
MRAIDVRDYLSILINEADNKEELEITINGLEINRIEYIKSFDSCYINDELIQITTD